MVPGIGQHWIIYQLFNNGMKMKKNHSGTIKTFSRALHLTHVDKKKKRNVGRSL